MSLVKNKELYDLLDERNKTTKSGLKCSIAETIISNQLSNFFYEPLPNYLKSKLVKIPMWEFKSLEGSISTSKPVFVTFIFDEQIWLAENDDLMIYATGETIDETLKAFQEHLVHFYKHYRDLSWDQVTGQAKRLKKIFQEEFKESL